MEALMQQIYLAVHVVNTCKQADTEVFESTQKWSSWESQWYLKTGDVYFRMEFLP